MNFEFFISQRINRLKIDKNLSHVFIKIAIGASALSLIVILLSMSVLDGFKGAIKSKISGFGAHIIITNHDTNNSLETNPIRKNDRIITELQLIDGVKNVQAFAVKAGLIKTETETQGVVLKGVEENFDWSFFENNLVRGRKFEVKKAQKTGKEVIISEKLSNITQLDTGDNLYMYFIEEQTRMRKYKIVGIYDSGLSDFDKLYVLTDIHDVEKLNNWNYYNDEEITGYEIILDNFSKVDEVSKIVEKKYGIKFDRNGNKLNITTLYELYPQIFDWLSLLDMNTLVLLIIMLVIASANMITALLILIIEKTRFIGVLKAMGATNWSIRKIFIYNGIKILIRGLIYGNIISLSIIFFQQYTHILSLNPEIYYVDYVPLSIDIFKIVIINISIILLTFITLILPSTIITKIDPVKAIKFN